MEGLVSKLTRLAVTSNLCARCQFHTASHPVAFRATPALSAEPMKKKKKVDNQQVVAKEAKRRRKLEKAIKRIESKGRKLKPVDEIDWDFNLARTQQQRTRGGIEISEEEVERRALLQKEWTNYQSRVFRMEARKLRSAALAAEQALQALREESEDLYQEAIQPDVFALPFSWKGPLNTPPIPDYEAPDGEYKDTTKDFTDQPQLDVLETMMRV